MTSPEKEPFFSSRRWMLVLVVAGIVLRLAQYLANRSLWVDEVYLAFNIADRSFGGLLRPLEYYQAAPVGFLMAVKAAFLALGNNEYALRLFPLLAGLASVPLFARAAKEFLGAKAAPIALGLFAILAPLVYFSSEVKQYSSDVAIAVLLYLVTLGVMRNGLSAARATLFGIAGGIAIWFSHPAVFLLAGAGTVLLWGYLAKKQWTNARLLSISFSIWGACFAALYYVSLRHLVSHQGLLPYWNDAFAPFPPGSVWEVKWYVDAFLGLFTDPTGLFFPGIGAFAFLAGFIAIYSVKREYALLLVSPIVFALAASMLHKYPFDGRLMLFAVPALLLFVGAGAERIIEEAKRISPGVGYIFLVLLFFHPLFFAGNHLIHPQEREEIKPVMRHVQENRRPGDVLYIYTSSAYAFRYYSDRYGFKEGDYIVGDIGRDNRKKYDVDLDRLRGHKRVWVLFSHVWKGGGVDDEKYILTHLDSIGKRLGAVKKKGASVYLYDLGENPAAMGTRPEPGK